MNDDLSGGKSFQGTQRFDTILVDHPVEQYLIKEEPDIGGQMMVEYYPHSFNERNHKLSVQSLAMFNDNHFQPTRSTEVLNQNNYSVPNPIELPPKKKYSNLKGNYKPKIQIRNS